MKISYNWLKQFISLKWDAEKTAALLTDLGLEVESIIGFSSVKGGLKGIVVGEVLECEKHINADRLKVTKVDLGNGKIVQIVCGASNVAIGQKVPVATIGTTLYDVDGKSFVIKEGNIRGEKSQGMICAEDELGLGKSHEGILVLDSKIEPGTLLSRIYEVENDKIFEIGLTPNRADAMSHWGVARDLRAGLIQRGVSVKLNTPSTSKFKVENRSLKMNVKVENPQMAPRYCGLTISEIKVGESPLWLQNRLRSIGLSPINNVVDATNYVMHELGQPLHAFDATKIIGNTIIVKTLPAGTSFITLDGVERKLDAEDLIICDAEKPLCLAGVFGGIHSGVTKDTTSIFLESAYFDPISIRKTAKRHGLNTDASFRFERGIDPTITDYALQHAANIIVEMAGGKITSDLVDLYPKQMKGHQVVLHFENTNKLIGEEIPKEKIKNILTSLEININNATESAIGMTIPAYRNDVTREADVIEEILRIYGYNNINFSEKLNASIAKTQPIEDYQVQNKVASQLIALGFHEIMANSLTNPKFQELVPSLPSAEDVTIINPLSQDLSVLRQSLIFGAMEALVYNLNRKLEIVKFFEFGKTYHKSNNGITENKHLALLLSGPTDRVNWISEAKNSDFFNFKGIIEAILTRLGIENFEEEDCIDEIYAEGISFNLNNTILVSFGSLHQKILKHFDVQSETFYADFAWDEILKRISTKPIKFQTIPKFPPVKRDFALLVDNSITFEDLKKAAFQTVPKLLKSVALFDVYKGENLPENKKSYALSFTLVDTNKTLTDNEIDSSMKKLQKKFEVDFGAVLR